MEEKILRYARIALEDEYGSKVDATTNEEQFIDIDIASAGLDAPSDPVMRYEGGLSRSVHTSRPGAYIPEGDLEYAFDIHTIAHLLYLALGNINQTNAGTMTVTSDPDGDFVDGSTEGELFVHEFTPTRHSLTLPSATINVGKDQFEQVFQGCVVNSLSFELDDDFAFVTIDISAQKDSKETIQPIENLHLSTAYPVAFYETAVQIGVKGGSQTQVFEVESLSLEITNNIDADVGVVLGSRYPQRIVAGDFEVTASMDMAFDSSEQLEHFWGAVDAPDDDAQDIMNINFIFSSAPYMAEIDVEGTPTQVEIRGAELDLHLPNVLYETVNIQPSGRDRLTQTVDARAYYDDEAQYEIIATLKNDVDYITDFTGFTA